MRSEIQQAEITEVYKENMLSRFRKFRLRFLQRHTKSTALIITGGLDVGGRNYNFNYGENMIMVA